ncbi:hypothetical protein BDR22DRAFT_398174 [Usnea florida]
MMFHITHNRDPEMTLNEGSRMPRKMIIARFHVDLPSSDDFHPHTHTERVLSLYVKSAESLSRPLQDPCNDLLIVYITSPPPDAASIIDRKTSGDNRAVARLRNSLTIANTTRTGSHHPCRYSQSCFTRLCSQTLSLVDSLPPYSLIVPLSLPRTAFPHHSASTTASHKLPQSLPNPQQWFPQPSESPDSSKPRKTIICVV